MGGAGAITEEALMSAKDPPDHPAQHGQPSNSGKGALGERLASPKVFIVGLITIAAVWFMIANNTEVRVRLWVPWVAARLWVVLLLTFVAGGLVGFLFARRRVRGE